MTPAEFAEFVRIAKDAGVERFKVGDLEVVFTSSPFAGAMGADNPLNKWSEREWGLAHTEGLPVPEKTGEH